jgi:hypothetical protein
MMTRQRGTHRNGLTTTPGAESVDPLTLIQDSRQLAGRALQQIRRADAHILLSRRAITNAEARIERTRLKVRIGGAAEIRKHER